MSRRSRVEEPAGSRALAELEPLLGELVAATASAATDHPDPGRLLAYHEGRLPAGEEEPLQTHLAACPACAAALLDLDAFAGAARSRERGPADLAAATAWRALAPRLAADQGDRRTPRRFGLPAPLRALAAVLLLAVPGLAILLGRSQGQVDDLRRALAAPQTEVPILYLDGATRDEGLAAATLELPEGDAFFLLAVTPEGATAVDRYRVEILDEDGRSIWRHDDVAPSDHGALRLGFTRRSLGPGSYRLEIVGRQAADPPTTFSFTVRDAAGLGG